MYVKTPHIHAHCADFVIHTAPFFYLCIYSFFLISGCAGFDMFVLSSRGNCHRFFFFNVCYFQPTSSRVLNPGGNADVRSCYFVTIANI